MVGKDRNAAQQAKELKAYVLVSTTGAGLMIGNGSGI